MKKEFFFILNVEKLMNHLIKNDRDRIGKILKKTIWICLFLIKCFNFSCTFL